MASSRQRFALAINGQGVNTLNVVLFCDFSIPEKSGNPKRYRVLVGGRHILDEAIAHYFTSLSFGQHQSKPLKYMKRKMTNAAQAIAAAITSLMALSTVIVEAQTANDSAIRQPTINFYGTGKIQKSLRNGEQTPARWYCVSIMFNIITLYIMRLLLILPLICFYTAVSGQDSDSTSTGSEKSQDSTDTSEGWDEQASEEMEEEIGSVKEVEQRDLLSAEMKLLQKRAHGPVPYMPQRQQEQQQQQQIEQQKIIEKFSGTKYKDLQQLFKDNANLVEHHLTTPKDISSPEFHADFYNVLANNLFFVISDSKLKRLSLNKTLYGMNIFLRESRKIAKETYGANLSTILSNQGLSVDERETAVVELRKGLISSVYVIRKVGNRGSKILYWGEENQSTRLFPARNSRFAALFYNELKDSSTLNFLRNQFLTFNDDFAGLSSELVAGYIGPVRTSLSTSVSRSSRNDFDSNDLEDKTDGEIQELVEKSRQDDIANSTLANVLAGGGLLALKAQYPILYSNPTWIPFFKFDNELVGNLSGQFPTAGSSYTEGEMNLWGSIGVENRAYLPIQDFGPTDDSTSPFGVFFQYNIRRVWGSGLFKNNLEIDEGFWFGEFKLGIFFNGIQITYSRLNFSERNLDGRFENSFTIAFAPSR